MAALTIAATKDFLLKEVPYILNGGNAINAMQTSIQRGYEVAGQWAIVGGVVGLIVAYKFEKSVRSLVAEFSGNKE